MPLIEEILTELESLPVDKQEKALSYVHSLKQESKRERKEILHQSFRNLSLEEVEEWEQNTQTCRTIDAKSW